MTTINYPEIKFLKKIYKEHNITLHVLNNKFLSNNKDFSAIIFSLENKSFCLYIDDEYQDLKIGNPILSLCLALRELENYEDANDYLIWCNNLMLKPENSQVRLYYMSLSNIYIEVENILGRIDSQISNFDFELNSGAAQELRKHKKTPL